jgi:hypothetical protein
MITGNSTLDAALEKVYQRWDRVGRMEGGTNVPLAEQGVKQIYKHVKGTLPRMIVWCDSPYQLAVLVLLLQRITLSITWTEVLARLATLDPAGVQWEMTWRKEWERILEREVNPVASILLGESAKWIDITESVSETAVQHLQEVLRKGAAQGALAHECLKPMSKHKSASGTLDYPPGDRELFGLEFRLANQIEQLAGIDATFDIPAIASMARAGFDSRWLARALPATEGLVLTRQRPEIAETLKQIKKRSEQGRNEKVQLLDWLQRLPLSPAAPTPNFAPVIGENEPIWRSALSIFGRVPEAYKEQSAIIRQRIAAPLIDWSPFLAVWIPFALGCRMVKQDIFKPIDSLLDGYAYLANGCAGHYFTKEIAFLCKKPLCCYFHANGLPHSETGPAVIWADNYRIYSWRGVGIPRKLIEDKNYITADMISKEQNAELRRVMIEIFGDARYLEAAGAELIHEDKYGQLYRLDLAADEPLTMVKVMNSTPETDGTFKFYYLRVPPLTKTAKEGVAWTFGMEPDQYNPQKES